MCVLPLSELSAGEQGSLQKIDLSGGFYRRLLEMGFQEDEPIECLFTAPKGSPIAFLVRGAVVALRKSDCAKIVVKKLE